MHFPDGSICNGEGWELKRGKYELDVEPKYGWTTTRGLRDNSQFVLCLVTDPWVPIEDVEL